MININKITDFKRSDKELAEFALFAIAVAGKNGKITASCVNKLVKRYPKTNNILQTLSKLSNLEEVLRWAGLGQQQRISRAIQDIKNINLRRCTEKDLLRVYGIGYKTAYFFLLHSRPRTGFVVLDIWVLRWLRDNGVKNVPSSTPEFNSEYQRLMNEAKSLFKTKFPKKSYAEIDFKIWKAGSSKNN